MSDQDLNSVEQEVVPQETEQDALQTPSEETPTQDAVNQADEQEKNWRAMRQRQKEMEWELKQKNEMLENLMKANQAPQVEEEQEIPDDEYIPASGVKGIAKKTIQPLEKKIQDLETRLEKEDQQKRINSLRTQYSDFDDVVNVETLEILEKTEPELAATIADLKDPYKMGFNSYKYIKALGLVDKLPNARRVKEVDKKIEQNEKTVQSPMAFDKRPMAQAYRTTAAEKKKLYEEMMLYAGRASGL